MMIKRPDYYNSISVKQASSIIESVKSHFKNIFYCIPTTKRVIVTSLNNVKRDLVKDYRADVNFKGLV